MTDAGFTKGPWVARQYRDPYFRITTQNRLDNRKVEIAIVTTQYSGVIGAEQQANLALILAAPDLYEALRKAVGMLEHASVSLDWDEEEAVHSQHIWDADVTSIRAALLKAQFGETK